MLVYLLVTDLSYKQEKSKEYIERARADKAKRQELLQERLDAATHSVRRGMELEQFVMLQCIPMKPCLELDD